jgi:HAD superfamily hydrolase (TIGR01490 family)
MTVAIFDLDETLLDGDSDELWCEYLVSAKLLDAGTVKQVISELMARYRAGELSTEADFADYYHFYTLLHPDTRNAHQKLFFERLVRPRLLGRAIYAVKRHQTLGHTVLVVTATTSFLAQPTADFVEANGLLATELELAGGVFTGKVVGPLCFREGKVHAVRKWLEQHGETLEESWFYSDSHNDLPLLRMVENPVAVNPDAELYRVALAEGWRVLSFRP